LYHRQKSHQELHQTYLQGIAEALVLKTAPHLDKAEYTEEKVEQTAAQIKPLLAWEKSRAMYRQINRCLKPFSSPGLTKLDIPDTAATDPAFRDPSQPKTWSGP
jgi:hypothetical protein